jgi:hypothetical protein
MAKHFRSLEAPWKRIGGWKWKICATKSIFPTMAFGNYERRNSLFLIPNVS